MSDPKRAECSICGRDMTVKKDGTMRDHTNPFAPRWPYRWAAHCDGSGRKPRESA